MYHLVLSVVTITKRLIDLEMAEKRVAVMGFEGSANKIGVGIVLDDGTILANVRHTYVVKSHYTTPTYSIDRACGWRVSL